MLRAAVGSLSALDHVLVCEGPVEGNEPTGPASELPGGKEWQNRLTMIEGAWETDAAKRTAMVEWCRARRWLAGHEVWGLWLDGDEILLWGEYLHDWLYRVSQQGSSENPVGGWPLPLVELDGSTVLCMGKLLRVDLVARYLVSSSFVELVNGDTRTVGNVVYWDPVTGPQHFAEGKPHWRARPPLQGEPHLQHRPILRSRSRAVERQHVAEERNYLGRELDAKDR
jgi:hypothetical protein